jgi:NAD(P)-dependent dehydrogenase (short-subunit alcohol dehydrogenase family)
METNFLRLIQTTIKFLPLLQKLTNAVIVNVSSEMGSNTGQARPNASFYAMGYNTSKAAVNSYTIALAQELRGEGIKGGRMMATTKEKSPQLAIVSEGVGTVTAVA